MMIDDLQTPLYKTNHKYRSYFPLNILTINNQAKNIKPDLQSFKRKLENLDSNIWKICPTLLTKYYN